MLSPISVRQTYMKWTVTVDTFNNASNNNCARFDCVFGGD